MSQRGPFRANVRVEPLQFVQGLPTALVVGFIIGIILMCCCCGLGPFLA